MKTVLNSLIIIGLFLTSCQTAQETQEPVREVQQDPVEPVPETPPEPPAEEEVIVNDETGFEVTKEVYEQTLDEMRILIDTLNSIISDRNYNKWKPFLSADYINTYNDPVKLTQISEQSQILSENDIELKGLQDYFEWVVVPSRSSAHVDDIVFIDDSRLVVYMVVKGKNTILYQLEKIDENWQISVW